MTEKCFEQLDRDESVNVEEILGGNVETVSGHIVACVKKLLDLKSVKEEQGLCAQV